MVFSEFHLAGQRLTGLVAHLLFELPLTFNLNAAVEKCSFNRECPKSQK